MILLLRPAAAAAAAAKEKEAPATKTVRGTASVKNPKRVQAKSAPLAQTKVNTLLLTSLSKLKIPTS